MAYPKEEMKAMADKCKEDYKEYCRNNGINYELKEAQRARRFKTIMESLTCPGCNKELRVSSYAIKPYIVKLKFQMFYKVYSYIISIECKFD